MVSLVVVTCVVATAAVVLSSQNSPSDNQTEREPSDNQTEREPFQPLSPDVEKIIKQDFFNLYTANVPEMTMDDVEIYGYYGTYNGCVVLDIGCKYLSRITVAGCEIEEGLLVPGLAIVWKEGNFYSLMEAYYFLGLLTKDDLKEISSISFPQ